VSLADRLVEALAAPTADEPQRPAREIPRGWEPGYVWTGTTGTITTPGLTNQPRTWDEFLLDAGLNPETVEVVEPVTVRGWDATQRTTDGANVTVRLHGYKLAVRRRGVAVNLDDLLALVKRVKGREKRPQGDHAFVVALGDLQLGKMDGDGPEGTLARTVEGIDLAVARLRAVRRNLPVGHVHLAWLGDCGEGFVSQGGDSAWRTVLTQTEQNRLVRRLMMYAIEQFAPLSDRVTQTAIPGNHDQAVRFGKGGTTRYDDSHDVEAMVAVADALTVNAAAFAHVQTLTPKRDELTTTTEIAGTILTHAHGHMWRPGQHFKWWEGQAFGDLPPGRADILLSAHGHHLTVEQRGARTYIIVPALECESTWWRHRTGQTGNPGVLTFTTNSGRIGDLHVT
jgi:hypothetical protein